MNYEEKYKQALETVQEILSSGADAIRIKRLKLRLQSVFPELLEREDEIIKNEIIAFVEQSIHRGGGTPIPQEQENKWLAWLEKQGEQTKERFTWKPSKEQIAALRWVLNNVPYNKHKEEINGLLDQIKDIPQKDFSPIEPKFKVRDWLQYRYAEPFLVEEITEQGYCNGNSCLPFEWEDEIHLWTIQDAKDGDILATSTGAFIYNGKRGGIGCPGSHCGINTLGRFQTGAETHWTGKKVYPATKEQRDILVKAMANAGYTFDFEKKELKKIESKTLDPDKVIEWLKHCNITDCDVRTSIILDSSPTSNPHFVRWFSEDFINRFKKDFGL